MTNDQHLKIFITGQIALLHMMQDNLLQDLVKAEEYLTKTKEELKDHDGFLVVPKKQGKKSKEKEAVQSDKYRVKSKRVMLDLLVCLAFVNFEWQEWEIAKKQFIDAHIVSNECLFAHLSISSRLPRFSTKNKQKKCVCATSE